MRNATTATRRLSTPLAICVLLALAAILSLMGAVPAAVPAVPPGAVPAQTTPTDYDTDDDGYIEVSTHAQLNAIRYDLDGNGNPVSGQATAYGTAFSNRDTNAGTRMGCPRGACVGYELTANIDLDTDGDGTHDSGDAYYNTGAGWVAIGTNGDRYRGNFKGNRYAVQNLNINRSGATGVGLFGVIENARIESLGVTGATVRAQGYTGILVGSSWNSQIVGCYSAGSVTATATTGEAAAGGLVGWQGRATATITSSYSTASVSGINHTGGLVGASETSSSVINSYSTGAVTRPSGSQTTIGGLIGSYDSTNGTVTASYYDSTTSGCVSTSSTGCTGSAAGTAQTTTQLQSPTTYTGIYAAWNINLDGNPGNDYPWNFGTASAYPTLQYGDPGDYDINQDNLIEVSNLAQLNAIRYDLDGDGARGTVSTSDWTNYTNAFPNANTGMGCASTCAGYELAANLDFDENGDRRITSADAAYWNSGFGWDPIGEDNTNATRYASNFKGNGYSVNNLYINRTSPTFNDNSDVGLFGSIHTTSRVETLGVTNANVTATQYVGILVGSSFGEVVACYTTGAIRGTGTNAGSIGGLVGYQDDSASFIESSYSTASVSGPTIVAGLLGNRSNGNVTNSYSTGRVIHTDSSNANTIGGLVGWFNTAAAATSSITNSYWNTTTSGQTASPGGGTGRTTSELQTPTGYTGIYSTWNANIDGSPGNDDPWDFGTASDYPLLKFGGHSAFAQGRGDFDTDNDGYIDVANLAQLSAIRHDLNGNGDATHADYIAAFPGRETAAANRMGCPAGACTGYELTTHLDFDENADGQITSSDAAYWNGGSGWDPIGDDSGNRYSGDFKGNGYTINNLYINRGGGGGEADVGLFGATNTASRLESLGITNANVSGRESVGILVGSGYGDIVACYTTGAARGATNSLGGLVGNTLMGASATGIHSSYSTASISGANHVGGLIGRIRGGNVTNSYSAGSVTGTSSVGGFIGSLVGTVTVTKSYWNTEVSGQSSSVGGSDVVGKTTRELQSPDAYAGIYSTWNADLDGATGNDNPWFFGSFTQYPTLIYATTVDYDADDDGYIDISNIAQLDAVRQDLDSDGDPASGGATAYSAAFPRRMSAASERMGCPSGTCTGYELIANLEFDSDADGDVDANDHSGAYWNATAGWTPIGRDTSTIYTGNFRGNGHTINNLTINSTAGIKGLFGRTSGSRIETVGVTNANITGFSYNGILIASQTGGVTIASYTTGKVRSTSNVATGGLVGYMTTNAQIKSSYSTAFVDSDHNQVGGLVGYMQSGSTITDSYSTGRVSGASTSTDLGGLVGHRASNAGAVTNSYWDTVSSGQSTSAGGSGVVGKTPRELQTVTDYSGIYANWNADLDGSAGNDDPWDFGNGMQYPMLKYDGMSTDPQGGQAMGVPDNWNAPVVGERVGVCLMDGPGDRATVTVSGTDYRKPWTWEKSTNGDAWTAIPGTGDGSSLPSYEYSPVAADAGSYLRAKVELSDGSFAYTRALGGRVIAASGATAGADIPFRRGHAAPQVGSEIVVSNPLPDGATDVRAGWQRCPNNTAPHTDCEAVLAVPGVYWLTYTPTDDDVGKYLRMYVYYETSAGVWTRRVTPFTTGVVAAQ